MPRRRPARAVLAGLALSASALAAVSASGVSAAAADPAAARPAGALAAAPLDALSVTFSDVAVAGAAVPGAAPRSDSSATYALRCGPAGGTHPRAGAACDRLDALTAEGRDPFAPVPGDRLCTAIYGGPATARITGMWHGRSVDASFSRTDGCEIARWHDLQPALPDAG